MIEVDLLIFDLDGTLLDTRLDLANAVNYARQNLGQAPLASETVMAYVGDGLRKLLERSLPAESHARLPDAVALFQEYYGEHLLDYSTFYAGAPEILAYFRPKKMAVVSNKPEEFTMAILAGLKVSSCFQVILGGDSLPTFKPSPEPLLHVLRHLRISPARTVMIGDSPSDIAAGKAAEVITCAVTYGYRTAEELLAAGPDYLIDGLPRLAALFK